MHTMEMDNYKCGFVVVIDILGFGAYTKNVANYKTIKGLMDIVCSHKALFESNLPFKYAILSDTIVIMLETKCDQHIDQVFFNSMIAQIGYIRKYVISKTHLFCRASITYGLYEYIENNNVIFGPAITRAVQLAEKPKDIIVKGNSIFNPNDRPAAIIIDNCFKNHATSEMAIKFRDGGITNMLECKSEFIELHSGYMLFNPYFSQFESLFGKNTQDGLKRDVNEMMSMIENAKAASPKHKEKYHTEEALLEIFIKQELNDYNKD